MIARTTVDTQSCLLQRDGSVVTVTLNRPQQANALSRDLVAGLIAIVADIEADPVVRACILTGAGERAFCAGADLKERAAMAGDEVISFLGQLRRLNDGLAALRCPVIAAVNGAAMGGGLELALACDLRLVAADASMGLTETSLAIIPGGGGTQRLPRLVGAARAKEMIYAARRIDADEALRIGLVNEVVPRGRLLERAREIAAEIAGNSPLAVAQAKRAIDRGGERPLEQALAIEQECYAPLLETADRVEALRAFAEKRRPVFGGR
ncbi:MAG: enoyl-CoA hydratase/isomerase family protein [Deltaproteobacteria bacterium]|nr:enoyl-CoA hydratase/isomerase family protein [Deltaproteobacteria bacterium]